ncbi:MAG TPA: hypothetical protein VHR65_06320 [Solirubrobacterales bacterium]|jgi:hypothetical protein|nr:hypothetical protein [Solirubrobacterales bacterium]
MSAVTQTRPPRGAIVVIAIGLIATLAAALLSTESAGGSSVEIEWVGHAQIPDSRAATIPGGGSIQLSDAELRSTEENIEGERIFRANAALTIAAGSSVGQGRVRCRMRGGGAELGRTVNSRGAFPRSSGEYNLTKQEVPGSVGIRFPIRGAEYASLEFEDAFPRFTDLAGVVVSWAPSRTASQEWQWGLPQGKPTEPLELGFASFWRTSRTPAAQISCTVTNSSGTAAVHTAGELSR